MYSVIYGATRPLFCARDRVQPPLEVTLQIDNFSQGATDVVYVTVTSSVTVYMYIERERERERERALFNIYCNRIDTLSIL